MCIRDRHTHLDVFHCDVLKPYRVPKSKIMQFGDDLRTAVTFGARKIEEIGGRGGVLIVADADDDCPANSHEEFLAFRQAHQFNVNVSFVLATKEYEAWMIACGEQMREHREIRDDAASHPQPESVSGAKGYFERNILLPERTYSETVDQAKFTNLIEIDVTSSSCRSFRKLISEIRLII